jgi:hypothetical protein
VTRRGTRRNTLSEAFNRAKRQARANGVKIPPSATFRDLRDFMDAVLIAAGVPPRRVPSGAACAGFGASFGADLATSRGDGERSASCAEAGLKVGRYKAKGKEGVVTSEAILHADCESRSVAENVQGMCDGCCRSGPLRRSGGGHSWRATFPAGQFVRAGDRLGLSRSGGLSAGSAQHDLPHSGRHLEVEPVLGVREVVGSVERVASAAVEGGMAIRLVRDHRENTGNLVRTAGPEGPRPVTGRAVSWR